jgi:hypothetical protein
VGDVRRTQDLGAQKCTAVERMEDDGTLDDTKTGVLMWTTAPSDF